MCPGYREGSVALLQPSAEWNVSDKIRGVLEVFFGCSCRLVLWQTNRPFAMHGLEEAQVLFACCAVAVARRYRMSLGSITFRPMYDSVRSNSARSASAAEFVNF